MILNWSLLALCLLVRRVVADASSCLDPAAGSRSLSRVQLDKRLPNDGGETTHDVTSSSSSSCGSSPVAPTMSPADGWVDVQGLYPFLSPGEIPLIAGHDGRFKDGLQKSRGWLEARDPRCADPTYIVACPINEPRPCCPPGYPVCCHPQHQCCPSGYFCVTYPKCCKNGLVGCGSNCCPAGTTCCDGTACCRSGYNCVSGRCISPRLSSMSEQSIASVQSMSTIASISRASVAMVQSSISVASVQSMATVSSLSVQSVATISSMSRLSVASISSIQASLSSVLVTQAGHTDSAAITTATVKPSDDRIKYDPVNAWSSATSGTGSSSSSVVGVCTNGTKVTQTAGAKFTFVFEGTSISLDIIASTSGGKFTVSVDGGAAMDFSSLQPNSSTGDQCIPSRPVSITNLQEAPHQIVVTNGITASGSSGGKLEFNGLTYTGRGAFGTPEKPNPGPSPAIIGGSVGGALGAIAIIGGGIAYFLYRKRRGQPGETATNVHNEVTTAGAAGAGAGATTTSQSTGSPVNQQTMSPYVVPTGMSSLQSLPSQVQPFGYSQAQHPYSQQPMAQYGYQQYGGQGSTSYGAPAAPFPGWVQRASQATDSGSPPFRPADSASTTSATHSQVQMPYGGTANPVNPASNPTYQPNPFYGTHYAPNQQGYSGY